MSKEKRGTHLYVCASVRALSWVGARTTRGMLNPTRPRTLLCFNPMRASDLPLPFPLPFIQHLSSGKVHGNGGKREVQHCRRERDSAFSSYSRLRCQMDPVKVRHRSAI
jgi:hypothetical protein